MQIEPGSTIAITGAASGIGRAWATCLASSNVNLVLIDLQDKPLAEVAELARASGATAKAIVADVVDGSRMEVVWKDVIDTFGHVDFLFNNAGIGIGGDAALFSPEDFARQIDVNIKGVTNAIANLYPRMKERGKGHIINTGSVAGLTTLPGMAAYSATKHAVVALTKALRIEARESGVIFTVVCPGAVRTPILTGGVHGGMRGYSKEAVEAVTRTWFPVDVEWFAKQSLPKILRGDAVVVVPAFGRIAWYMSRFLPLSLELWLSHVMHKRNKRLLDAAESALQSRSK